MRLTGYSLTALLVSALACGGDSNVAPPTTGTLRVTTSTGGTDPDPDGYTVQIDVASPQAIGGSATLEIPGLAAGAHTVQLGGIAANCAVAESNPRSVNLLAGETTTVEFAVTCSAPGAGLQVSSTTTGAALDPDGYAVLLDGSDRGTLAPTGSINVDGVAPGLHKVGLSGVAANCTVQGPNPQTVTMSDVTTNVSFAISCVEPSGSVGTLTVATTTSGGNTLDPDGYLFAIDGGASQPIPTNGLATVANLSVGTHSVLLSDLAINCDVRDTNPRSIEITAGATVTLNFITICSPVIGSIEVTTQTSGLNPDPDGYTLSIDAGSPQSIASNTTVTLEGIAPGTHTLTLAGIAGNCRLEGDNPREVNVPRRAVASVTFGVTCGVATPPIAFTSNAADLLAVFVVNPDGTGLTRLADGLDPVWSPDGSKILFAREFDLAVMDADGSNQTALAQGTLLQYRWSPDGRLIAYVAETARGQDFVYELWVMRADGGGKIRLAENATSPTWSPDGARIAYSSAFGTLDPHIRIIGADGAGDSRLTSPDLRAFEPAWSPDGSRIAFVTIGDKDIFLINPAGSGLLNLTRGSSEDDDPTWSPDGSMILFTTEHAGQPGSGIAVMNRDGTRRMDLTSNPESDFTPAWSPDGRRIVFVRSILGTDFEIYVMNADGSDLTNITNRPDAFDSSPNWGAQGSATMASRLPGSRASMLRVPDLRRRWKPLN
jgi:Tol biopolymer transport system component